MRNIFRKIFPKKKEEIRQYRRITDRIRILPIHGVKFFRKNESKPVELINLSVGGVGFLRSTIEPAPNPSESVHGYFLFKNKQYPVSLRVLHASPNVVGCIFEGDNKPIRDMIFEFFSVELSAARMKEVKSSVLKAVEDGKPRLYRDEGNCELFLVEDGEGLLRFTLTFYGNYIDCDEKTGLTFGLIEENAEGEFEYLDSAGIKHLPSLPEEIMQAAVRMVDGIDGLPEKLRTAILEKLG